MELCKLSCAHGFCLSDSVQDRLGSAVSSQCYSLPYRPEVLLFSRCTSAFCFLLCASLMMFAGLQMTIKTCTFYPVVQAGYRPAGQPQPWFAVVLFVFLLTSLVFIQAQLSLKRKHFRPAEQILQKHALFETEFNQSNWSPFSIPGLLKFI